MTTRIFISCLTYSFFLFSDAFYSYSKRTFVKSRNAIGPLQGSAMQEETELLNVLQNIEGRGVKATLEDVQLIEKKIASLEAIRGQFNPTSSPLVDGCWKLLYTSSPGTNSPIQRTFTASDKVSVFQVVNVADISKSFLDGMPDVSNVVCFGENGRLRVTALASTKERNLVDPRKGDGKIFGLNIFGISSSAPPRDPSERIDFAFQDASFEFRSLPLKIPYPVPFKLLGDEAKGWIDVTYLSSNLRIVRGNKGTTFVLQRADVAKDPIAAWATTNLNAPAKKSSPPLPSAPSLSPSSSSSQVGSSAEEPIKAKFLSKIFNTFGLMSGKGSVRGKPEGASREVTVTIICPCQLGEGSDYLDLMQTLSERGVKSVVAPLQRLDWPIGLLPSFFSADYFKGTLRPSASLAFYFRKVDEAVAEALAKYPGAKLNILGHSIGGWIARAWLSEWCDDEVRKRVKRLVTIGSPHVPPPPDSAVAVADQTRGLLTYVEEKFPGAYEKGVSYTSVIGTSVTGELSSGISGIVAFASYTALSGVGNAAGDGIIPVDAAVIKGGKLIVIEDVNHSNFIPFLPGNSIKLNSKWYGSSSGLDAWVNSLLD